MAGLLSNEPPAKRLRHEAYVPTPTRVTFELAAETDGLDNQLAYLEDNLPEELFDTATGRAWVSTWNQEAKESGVLVKSASGSSLSAEPISTPSQAEASTSQHSAIDTRLVQISREQCNVSIQTDPPFSAETPQSVASAASTHGAVMSPEIKMFAQQQMLLVLLHSLRCEKQKYQTHSEQQASNPCTRPICTKMKSVLAHLRTCRVTHACPEHFCSFTRSILMHFRSCKLSNCSLCIPVKQLCVNNPSASLEWLLYQLRANAGLLLSDLRNLAIAAKSRPAPKPPVQAPVIPTCSICMDRLISTIVFPCRHFFCEQCAPMIFKCGLCRQPIRNKYRVYF